jgi:TPR repeat protein
MALCGNGTAFAELESMCERWSPTSTSSVVVSLGYLMMLLHNSVIPDVIPPDKDRAMSIAQDIFPMLKAKIYENSPGEGNGKLGMSNHHEQLIFGFMSLYGLGVAVDEAEAFRWFSLSANQGDASAQ